MGGFNFKKRGLRAGWQLLLLQWLVPLLALAASSAAVAEGPAPTFSKVFTPNAIGPGSVSTATFTINNEDSASAVTALTFSDPLPAAITIADPANASTDCALGVSGTLSAPDGGSTIALSDAQIGSSQSCTVTVDVTASTPGFHTNPAVTLSSSAGSSMSLAIDLEVNTTLPGFSKSFAPSSVSLGGRSTLTFSIDNGANASRVGNLDFTDNLPPGMVVADPPNATTDCVSAEFPDTTLAAVPGTATIVLNADGSNLFPGLEVLPAGATCTVTVDVTATGTGMLDNVANDLLADFTSAGKASDTLEVTVTPLALRKSFIDDPVSPGDAVILEFIIDNLDRNFSATGVAFTDDLTTLVPMLPGLTFDSVLSNGCGGSIFGVGTTTIGLSGSTLAAEGSCTLSVSLSVPEGTVPGIYTNTTSTVTGTVDGSPVVGNMASDDLYVEPMPLLTLEFLEEGTLLPDPMINSGDDVVLRYTITNTSTTSMATDIAFDDELTYGGPLTGFLPFPVSVTLPGNPVCGGNLTLVPFGDERQGLRLTGGSLAAAKMPGDSCSFDVTVTIPADMQPGVYLNTTEEITATVDGATRTGNPASDDLTMIAAPTLRKAFADDPVAPGGTVTLEFILDYSANATDDATAITFTDDLAAALAGLTATGLPITEACDPDGPGGNPGTGTLSGSAGDTLLTFMGGSLSPGESCTISVSLSVPMGAASGPYTNTTSGVGATVSGTQVTSPAASDDLEVGGMIFTKEFLGNPAFPGKTLTLRFTLENISAIAATGIGFEDSLLPVAGLVATDPALADDCGGGLTVLTIPNLGSVLTYAGGSLAAGVACNLDVEVTVPATASDGTYENFVSGVSYMLGATPGFDGPAIDDLIVDSDQLSLFKTFTDDPVAPGDSVTLEFTLTNLDAGVPASAIGFTDDLGAALTGLTFDSVLFDDCGGTVSGTGTDLITVTGASLGAGGSCTLRVSLTVPGGAGAGIYTNTTSDVTGDMSGFPVTGIAASDNLEVIQLLPFSKSFDGPTTATGTATLTFTITNPGADTVSDLHFSDDLDAVIPGLIAFSLPALPCGAGSSINGTSFLTLTGGELPPSGGSCSFDVEVLVPVTATPGTYPNTTSELFQSGLLVAEPATADLTIEPAPAFDKVFAPDTIFAGGTSTLKFTIDNTASALAASSLVFTDSLPAGILVATPAVTISGCGGTLSAVPGSGSISLVGGTVAASAACTIEVDVTGTASGSLLNITGDLISSSGNSGTASDTLTVTAAADLSVSKTDGVTSATPGGLVSYTIVVANAGPSADPTVTLNDTFASPPLVCNWTSIAAGSATGNTPAGAGDIAETLSMPAGSMVTYTADCHIDADASGTLVNTASITPSITDTDPGNNSATDSDTLLVPLADLAISKSDGVTSAVPGQTTLVYTIQASNNGLSDDPSVSVADTFPPSLSCGWTSAAAGGATGNTATGSGNIAETLSMPAGSSVTYTASCSIASFASGTLSNTATISGSVADPDTGNNSATDWDTVLDPEADLSVSKTNGVTAVIPGQSMTYTIVAANAGPSADASASVSDAYPAELSCSWTSAAAGGATGNTATGSGNIAETLSLPVGSSVTYTADCALATDATGTLTNTATISASVVDSDSGNNSATDIDDINQIPGFTKAFLPDLIALGEASTLTFTIDNSGSNIAATGLAFTDNLPSGILVATPQVSSNTCGGTLTATSGSGVISLAGGTVGATASCTIAVDVTGTLAGSHLNTTGDLTSSLGNSGTASDTLTVNPQPGFSKEFGPDTIGIGQVSTLNFVIDNSGSSVAAEVLTFTDQLPAGVLVNTPPATANTCGGTLTADEGAGVVSLAGGLVGDGASCSISVDVTATDLGVLLNTTSELVSSLGSSSAATDTLNVIPTLTVAGAGVGSGTVTGAGIDCTVTGGLSSGDCSESVAVGTLITLTAAADPGSEAPVWDGCDSVYGASGEICDITLSVDAAVTVAFSADDGDGVPGAIEDLVENPDGAGNGDGNGDGTADRLQSHVTSLLDNTGVSLVTVANNTGKHQQDSFNVSPAPTDVPPGVSFPVGLLEFRVTGVPVGGTVEMSVYVPGDIQVNAYYKPNTQGIWVNVAKDITTVGNKTLITFDLTDGGEFDGDNLANANLLDPGAPAFEHPEAKPVPTMNLWGLLMLSTLMGLMLLWHGRRKLN